MSSTQEAGDLFGSGIGPAHAMLRSPTVVIAAVGLWGMNLYFFRVFGIDYIKILKYDLLRIDGGLSEDSIHRYLKKDLDHNGLSSGDYTGTVSTSGGEPPSLDEAVDGNASGMAGAAGNSHTMNSSSNNNSNNLTNIHSGNSLGIDLENDDFVVMDTLDRPPGAITWYRLVALSFTLLFLLHFTYFLWIDRMKGGPVGAVLAFYTVVAFLIFVPIPTLDWLRRATVMVLQRGFELLNPRCSTLVNPESPPRPIPFVDVFYADALCSLSKVFFDWGILLHIAASPESTLAPKMRTILLPSTLAAIPYIIRTRQCLVMYTVGNYRNDPKRYQHLANALKYATSIFPLCLSAYSKTLDSVQQEQALEYYLVLLLIVNACYALYWDIVMDWGMMQNPTLPVGGCGISLKMMGSSATNESLDKVLLSSNLPSSAGTSSSSSLSNSDRLSCGHLLLRKRLRFGVAISVLIVIADTILRFSWILRFHWTRLFNNEDSYVLCTQFLEIFRRALWNLLRMEWEHIKQQTATSTSSNNNKGLSAAVPRTMSGIDDSEMAILRKIPKRYDEEDPPIHHTQQFLPSGKIKKKRMIVDA